MNVFRVGSEEKQSGGGHAKQAGFEVRKEGSHHLTWLLFPHYSCTGHSGQSCSGDCCFYTPKVHCCTAVVDKLNMCTQLKQSSILNNYLLCFWLVQVTKLGDLGNDFGLRSC